jgi:hypothetical protein
MKTFQRVSIRVAIAMMVAGLLISVLLLNRNSAAPVRPNLAESVSHESSAVEQSQAVGWVFGRLMGYPGADKPLLMTESNQRYWQVVSPPSGGVP